MPHETCVIRRAESRHSSSILEAILTEDKTIHHQTQDEHGEILVIDQGQFRILTFGSPFEQSCMDKLNPNLLVHEYMQAMMLVLAFIKPSKVTLLGLGAGCLLRSLYQNLSSPCTIEAVELRQKVVEVAQTFFSLPTDPRVSITINNAHRWLKETPDNHTQLIFADLFHAEGLDPMQMQKRFIQNCHRILDKKGWLVLNYHKMPDLEAEFFQYISKMFTEIFVCPISSGNNIMFASKVAIKNLGQFDSQVALLEKKLTLPMQGYFRKLTRLKERVR